MILRLFLKQQKLFLVIVVECVHTILFSIYLFKQMDATFTDDHKIYVQKKISLMYSPVCDFSRSSTECWISAHTWSCGHGYRLCVLCSVGLPALKYMSGIARVLCLTVPGCQSQTAGVQGLCLLPQTVSACGGPEGGWYQSCLRCQVKFPCPDSFASSATVAVSLCLWVMPAQTWALVLQGAVYWWTVQAAPEESRVQLGAQRCPGPAVLP